MSRGVAAVLAASLLTGLVLVTFLPTLGQGWAPIDDGLNFTRNEHYRGLGWENLRWMWTTRLAGHYIPLSWMTLGADYLLSGMNATGYHRTNLLLHVANALLFFALALRLFRGSVASVAGSPAGALAPALAAFAAAALFALHPLRVESVAWITERRDLLCGLFCLLAVHSYLDYVTRRGRRRAVAYGLALAAFAAALLSKGIAIVLPAALLALDAGPLHRLDSDPRRWRLADVRALLMEKLPFLALSALFAAVTFWAIAPVLADAATADLQHRLLSAGFGLSFYLEKTLLPVAIPFQIPATTLLTVATHPTVAMRGIAFLAVLGAALVVAWRWRRPQPALALLVFTAFVLPVSGLFQAGPQLAAHRYTYLSCLSLALLLGGLLERSLAAQRLRRTAIVAAVVLAVALVLAHQARAEVALWRDDLTFCRAAVRDAPLAWGPVGALARALVQNGAESEAVAVLRAGRLRIPQAVLLPYLEALVLATSADAEVRDGTRAFQLAEQACRATSFQDPAALLALAAAAAETGDGRAARRLIESAEALALAGRKSDLLPLLDEVSRRIARDGRLQLSPEDWKHFPL